MRILLTNDDGVEGAGLAALAESLEGQAQLYIVAPDQDRSGTGHAITVREHLTVKPVLLAGRWKAYAASGTPADCVKLALLELCPQAPDLVVAGINPGANLGIDVFYSGTVAAALEGALMGIPSLAVSCITQKEAPRFAAAQRVVPALVQWLLASAPGRPLLLNVNVPELAREGADAIRWTRLALNRRYRDRFERSAREDGHHRFQLAGDADEADRDDLSTDAGAVHHRFVSVTPIQFDLTDYPLMSALGCSPGTAFTAAQRSGQGPPCHVGPCGDGQSA